jgi:hypothetical protein
MPSELSKAVILEKVVMKLATHFELQKHENGTLHRAITEEKKCRNRNKRLNLIGEAASQAPQFFSPNRVLAARECQETKEAAEQEERCQKALRKKGAARQRAQALADKQEAALQRKICRDAAREAKEAKKAKKAAEREAKRVEQVLAKEAKELATAKRKKELEERKNNAAVAAENSSKSAPAGPSRTRKKAPIPRKKVLFRTSKAAEGTSTIEQANTTAGPARVAVAVEAAVGHSRRGRALVLPQRFKD